VTAPLPNYGMQRTALRAAADPEGVSPIAPSIPCGEFTMRVGAVRLLFLLASIAPPASHSDVYVAPWVGRNPKESGLLCPDGSAGDGPGRRLSWGGDAIARLTSRFGLWMSVGSRRDGSPCVGTVRSQWLGTGAILSSGWSNRLSGEVGAGGGIQWRESDARAWMIEGRAGMVGRLSGRLGLSLCLGAQRREGHRLSGDDLVVRAGLRLGPL